MKYRPQRKQRCRAKSTAFGQCELDRGHKGMWHRITRGNKVARWTNAGDMQIEPLDKFPSPM